MKKKHKNDPHHIIVERRKAPASALMASEAVILHLVEHAGDAIIIHNAKGLIIEVNRRACEALGYSRSELLEKHVQDIDVSASYRSGAGAAEGVWQCVGPGISMTSEGMFQHKNGSRFPVESRISMDEINEQPVFLQIVRDITERKELEQNIKSSEARFRTVFNNVVAGMIICDPDGKILHANPAFCRMLGYSEEDLQEKTLSDVCHPDDRKETRESFRKGRAGVQWGGPSEKRYLRKDGGVVWALLAGNWLHSPNGMPVTMVAHVQDITQQKMATVALAQSEQRLKAIMDNTTALIYAKGVSGGYLFANAQFGKLFGEAKRPIAGRTDLDLFPRELAERFRENDQEVINKKKPVQFEEVFYHGKNPHTYLSIKFPLYDAEGHVSAVCGVSSNITERKQKDEEVSQAWRFVDSILENIPDMIFVKDAEELRFVRFNKAGEGIVGLDRKVMIGKNDYDFFPQAQADFFTKKDREVLKNGVLVEIPEEPIETRLNGTRFLRTKKIPILDPLGKPLYLLGISEDITDKRAGSRDPKGLLSGRSTDPGPGLDEGLRQMIESAPCILLTINLAGQILSINRTVEGLDRRQVIGSSVFEYVSPDQKDYLKSCMDKVFETRQPIDYEIFGMGDSGQMTHYESRIGPLFDGDDIVGFVIVAS